MSTLGKGIFCYLSDKVWEPVYKLFALVTTHYFDVCGPEFLKKSEGNPQNALTYILNELQSKFQAFFLQQDNDFQKNVDYLTQQIMSQFEYQLEINFLLNDLVGIYAKEYFTTFYNETEAIQLTNQLAKQYHLSHLVFIQHLFITVSRSAFFKTHLFDYSVNEHKRSQNLNNFKILIEKSVEKSFFQCFPWNLIHSIQSNRGSFGSSGPSGSGSFGPPIMNHTMRSMPLMGSTNYPVFGEKEGLPPIPTPIQNHQSAPSLPPYAPLPTPSFVPSFISPPILPMNTNPSNNNIVPKNFHNTHTNNISRPNIPINHPTNDIFRKQTESEAKLLRLIHDQNQKISQLEQKQHQSEQKYSSKIGIGIPSIPSLPPIPSFPSSSSSFSNVPTLRLNGNATVKKKKESNLNTIDETEEYEEEEEEVEEDEKQEKSTSVKESLTNNLPPLTKTIVNQLKNEEENLSKKLQEKEANSQEGEGE